MIFLTITLILICAALVFAFCNKRFKFGCDSEDITCIIGLAALCVVIAVVVIIGKREYYQRRYVELKEQTQALQCAWENSGGYLVEKAVIDYNKAVTEARGKQVTWNGSIYFKKGIDFKDVPLIDTPVGVKAPSYNVNIGDDNKTG